MYIFCNNFSQTPLQCMITWKIHLKYEALTQMFELQVLHMARVFQNSCIILESRCLDIHEIQGIFYADTNSLHRVWSKKLKSKPAKLILNWKGDYNLMLCESSSFSLWVSCRQTFYWPMIIKIKLLCLYH